ncbi:MAG: 3-phosphoshikimate 1-carboxyvinyltransferase [Eggerthellaceae bacterium]|nr:3-phosphoshikimate 1-carboxyvinyltransferase [Eggerthellaceae bacterium]
MSNDEITVIEPLAGPLEGHAHVPGDKSISHRAVFFSAMAEGTSQLYGVLNAEDVLTTINVVKELGADVNLSLADDGSLEGTITGWGEAGPRQPDHPIYCGNSGTTVRLLMGILAPWPIRVELTGDDSLCHRPMRRITAPLMKMGARFEPAGKELLPLTIIGNPHLRPLKFDAPMASAQLKTAVLLAGLSASGTTTVNEPFASRNHTELMLPEYGAQTTAASRTASVKGPVILKASEVKVPGDPSSASFLVCAAILTPGSDITIDNVSLNNARIGFVRTLERMGAQISEEYSSQEGKEPNGSISAKYTPNLRGCEIPSQHIASLIDEIPVLSFVAAHAKGVTVFKDVSELRIKETDRLKAIIEGLELLGIEAWEQGDDLMIQGDPGFEVAPGLVFDSHNDHRLAMTWALAGLTSDQPVSIKGFESVSISYPNFLKDIRELAK